MQLSVLIHPDNCMARAGNALTPLPTLTANRNRSNWPAPLTVVRKGGQSAVKVTLGALHDHGRPHARQHAVASQATLPRCAPRPQPPAQRLRPPLGPGLQRDQPPGRGSLREVPGPRRLQVPLVNREPRRTAGPGWVGLGRDLEIYATSRRLLSGPRRAPGHYSVDLSKPCDGWGKSELRRCVPGHGEHGGTGSCCEAESGQEPEPASAGSMSERPHCR